MKKLLLLALIGVGFAFTASAELEKWSWDAYKTTFEVPADFKITKNDDKQFSAGNKALRMTIFPVKGKAPSTDKLAETLLKWVDSNKIVYTADNIDVIEDLNGYAVSYIEGTKDKSQVFAGLFFNPLDDNVRLYVLIYYTQADYETALAMLKSFAPASGE